MDPTVGLILPPANRPLPPEASTLYPTGVRFLVECLGLERMTPEGYEGVIDKIVPAAERLAQGGAQAIGIMGTSLTFYKGAAFNRQLIEEVTRATGLPATTMSTALVDGLRIFGARKLAVATAYSDEVNQLLATFLEESGYLVAHVEGLGFTRIGMAGTVPQTDLLDFSVRVWEKSAGADAIVVSCGGLRTLEMLAPLEHRCGAPVVSSMPHAIWAAVRLLGSTRPVSGYGQLLASMEL
jgi:arylmalonate decarboxylase